ALFEAKIVSDAAVHDGRSAAILAELRGVDGRLAVFSGFYGEAPGTPPEGREPGRLESHLRARRAALAADLRVAVARGAGGRREWAERSLLGDGSVRAWAEAATAIIACPQAWPDRFIDAWLDAPIEAAWRAGAAELLPLLSDLD